MLKKLYELGCFDYQKFITQNSKKLSVSCNEAMVLINILDQYSVDHKMSIDKISESLNMTVRTIQNTLSSLMERELYQIFITYDNGLGHESISLDGFFKKCQSILENDALMPDDEIHVVSKYLSVRLNRILTSQEIDIITSLVMDDRYNLDDFKNACDSLDKKKRLITIRSLAQALASGDKKAPEVNATPGFVKDFFQAIK